MKKITVSYDEGGGAYAFLADESVQVGDRVALPGNAFHYDDLRGTVTREGADYDGPCKRILRVFERTS